VVGGGGEERNGMKWNGRAGREGKVFVGGGDLRGRFSLPLDLGCWLVSWLFVLAIPTKVSSFLI